MIRNLYNQFVQGKLFEWVMALNMIFSSLILIAVPAAIAQSAFRYLALTLNPSFVAYFILVFGVFRLGALIANGRTTFSRRVGPYLRIAGACAGGFIWFQMEISLWMLYTETHLPSPGLSVWLCLTVGEIATAYQAGKDARRSV